MATTTELLKLQAWLSPAFPVGAFSYSHGLEWAVEAALVTDRATLTEWIEGLLSHGAGRIDAMLFAAAWRAEKGSYPFSELIELAAAFRGTRELALETAQQGEAFARSVGVGWGAAPPAAAYPVAVGAAARAHGIALETALPLFVQAFAANLVSAGVRLIPLGQSDGLRALAALEEPVRAAAQDALTAPLDDLGAASPMLDWCSMKHETQYTRLFRS